MRATELTDDPGRAAEWLRAGACVAFPTETVYGLGADATDAEAVAGIFRAKGRPVDNPLIVHLADASGLPIVATEVPDAARRILARFAPGPVTVIVPRAERIPALVSAGLDTVGVRIPAHETAHAFLVACGRPVAAPSANRSGRPSPTTWEAVVEDLGGRIACVLRGARSRVGLESTVVDCTTEPAVVLRTGAVTVEALRRVVPGLRVADGSESGLHRSPGTRHPHYAPAAAVRLVAGAATRKDETGSAAGVEGTRGSAAEVEGIRGSEGVSAAGRETTRDAAWIGLGPAPGGYGLAFCARDVEEYAHALFDFFRRCDEVGIRRIDCARVARRGLGRALMDRLERAEAAARG